MLPVRGLVVMVLWVVIYIRLYGSDEGHDGVVRMVPTTTKVVRMVTVVPTTTKVGHVAGRWARLVHRSHSKQ